MQKNGNELFIPNENKTSPTTASSSGIGCIAEPTTGMTTVMSTEGSVSGGSGSTDVPNSTGNNSHVEDGRKVHIKDDGQKSPKKKFTQHIEMKALDKFQTLTSTKQNIELFKILTAIAIEIDGLQKSTEKRFSLLETLVVKAHDVDSVPHNGAGNEHLHQNTSQTKVTILI